MDRQEIESKIEEFGKDPGWYQSIDLKNGMRTQPSSFWGGERDHPRRRWELVSPGFPESFEGKSVLDVGCNAGFFSFIAAERGSDDICGIDYNQKYVDQAKFCSAVRGDHIDFRQGEVNSIAQMGRQFDITLCIGLLYHVPDIWGAIRAIGRVTKEMTIVESAILNDNDQQPLVLFAGKDKKKAGTWHPNILALEHMFQVAGFSRTEVLFKDGGRGGIVAYK